MIQFNAPHAPGVYLFKDGTGRVIYVGKAKDLKKRVSSYFYNKKLEGKTMRLVETIQAVDFVITNNESEALILESNLIKKFQSKYNVDLRASYRYPFVRITEEVFPKIEVVRAPKKNVEGSKNVFGPFVDASARKRMVELVEKSFKIRTCKKLPPRACLKFYMGHCLAPCIGNISQEDYAKNVEKAKRFFAGERVELATELETEMKDLASKRLFELAIIKRDALKAISGEPEKQMVDVFTSKNRDFIAWRKTSESFSIQLFNFRRGTLYGKKSFVFRSGLVEKDILEDFFQNYYSEHRPPNEIVLRELPATAQEIELSLSELAGHAVKLVVPLRGENKRILDLVEKNLDFSAGPAKNPLEEIKNALFLPSIPSIIECFDVSHLGGSDTTASMVSFLGGKPNKAQYRQFKIRKVRGIDDYAAMQEVVGRRYKRVIAENLPLPDLVLIDGGKGQVSAAMSVLKDLGLNVPVVGLAKREEELFIPARQTAIVLGKDNPGLQVLMNVRDEAHRFANRYRKKLKEKSLKTR